MKAKVTKTNPNGFVKTAVLTGTLNGKTIELGVSNTNSTWEDVFGTKSPKVGDEIELDDSSIAFSEAGRAFIQRSTVASETKVVQRAELKARFRALTV
jgi:hypothetical protein